MEILSKISKVTPQGVFIGLALVVALVVPAFILKDYLPSAEFTTSSAQVQMSLCTAEGSSSWRAKRAFRSECNNYTRVDCDRLARKQYICANQEMDNGILPVSVAGNNAAPTFSGRIGDQAVPVGADVNFPLSPYFSDPNGDTLTYSLAPGSDQLPGELSLNPSTGLVSGTASTDSTSSITIMATDSGDLSVSSDTLILTIGEGGASESGPISEPEPEPNSDNTTPTFSGPIGNQDAPQGESINFPLTSFFSDPDGDTLTYSVAPSSDALPSGLTLSASSGDVTGTASPAGTYSMTFRATDPGNLSADSDTFTFTITGSGGGPVCGNNTLESGEQCDDGNTAGGDGCSAICQTESGTTPVCGNNITEIGEQCDDGNTTSNDGCSASCQTENTPPPTGIIFETNFANDTGYSVSNTNLWNGNGATPPSGWDGVKATGTGSLFSVQPGTGVSGGNALRVKYAPGSSQPTMSLGKHLTGNRNTGYDEIYIRYNVKLPDNFRVANNGNSINHWKWGRLYQNTSTNNTDPGKWTENRSDSGFILWVFNGSVPTTDMNVSWAENSGANLDKGSAGGPHQKVDYYASGSNPHTAPGYFERLFPFQGPSESNPGRLSNNPQTWHTLEFRYKLATTSSSDDGEMEMWWDGVNQGDPTRVRASGGAPSRNGIPTTNRGSGMNFFLLFDNLSGWNSQWASSGVDGSVYVNDVVISTDRIGHSYTAGNTDNVN